ncbi:hypothetical protein BDZ97DRAFT_1914736 [Flammula alnicola]|nr:hypothetical protein BDZ97DRAFT_1914736 [Flammula alnicola]
MRYAALITLQVALSAVILAVPIPFPDVKAGDIVKGRPKYFEYPMPKTKHAGQHPLIALSEPDEHGWVKVAPMSHSHPMNPPTKPASTYGLPIDPIKGESHVNVAAPDRILLQHLKATNTKMEPHHFQALKKEIHKNCPGALRRRNDSPDPCNRQSMQRAALLLHQQEEQAKQAAHAHAAKSSRKIQQGAHTGGPHQPAHAGPSHQQTHVGSSQTGHASSSHQQTHGGTVHSGPSGSSHGTPHSRPDRGRGKRRH